MSKSLNKKELLEQQEKLRKQAEGAARRAASRAHKNKKNEK